MDFRLSAVTVDCVEPDVLARFRAALLGGRSLDQRHDYAEGIVVVMADPEGNEFCMVEYSG